MSEKSRNTENVNTLAIAWEHKYRVLQGKYNAETRDLRQALMFKDKIAEKHKQIEAHLREQVALQGQCANEYKKSRTFWRKQAGVFCFIICTMAVAVLVLWLILQQTQSKLEKAMEPSCKVEGEMYYADPEVVTAPPSAPVFEL